MGREELDKRGLARDLLDGIRDWQSGTLPSTPDAHRTDHDKPEMTVERIAYGLDFSIVAKAMDMSNVCSYLHDEVGRFLEENGLVGVPAVWMATHSWGGREWRFEEGRTPPFFRENGDGGWFVCTQQDVNFLHCSSATSGSSLTAEKGDEGKWVLTLRVPIRDGAPYQGAYWQAFQAAKDEQTQLNG